MGGVKNDEEMLGQDVEVTVIQEYRTEESVWGGGYGGGGGESGGGGSTETYERGGGSSGSGNSVQPIESTPPLTAEEAALAARLKRGEATPEEALAWFQTHGYPQLNTLPSFDGTRWIFPQPHIDGSSADGHIVDEVIFATSGEDAPPASTTTGTTRIPIGRNEGEGEGNGGSGPVIITTPHPHGFDTATESGIDISDSSGGPGRHIDTFGKEGPKIDTGEDTPPPPPYSGGPAPVDSPDDAPDDDDEILPYQVHFADNELDGAMRDILDDNNPFFARLILAYYIPLATIGVFVERYFVNPLLAAPVNTIEGGKALRRAADALGQGNIRGAMDEYNKATEKLRDAALAVASVIPVGGAAAATEASLAERLAGRGVKIVKYVDLPIFERVWAAHQYWVTGCQWEIVFEIEGMGQLGVDGFHSATGESILANPGAHTAVETKIANRIEYILSGREAGAPYHAVEAWYNAIKQLDGYFELVNRLELKGVTYVVTETPVIVDGVAHAPITAKWYEVLLELYPDKFRNGLIEVLFKEPPPAGWPPAKPVPGGG